MDKGELLTEHEPCELRGKKINVQVEVCDLKILK